MLAKFALLSSVPILLLTILTHGCNKERLATQKSHSEAPKELRPILQAVQDSVMVKRWKQAYEAKQMPLLETLPKPGQVVFRRMVVKIEQDTVIAANPPFLPDKLIATVEPFSITQISEYHGLFLVTDISPEKIKGTLEMIEQPMEIYYRLPEKQELLLEEGMRLNLTLTEKIVRGSFTRMVSLLEDSLKILLFYLSDGSSVPYNRKIEDIGLTIIQHKNGEGNRATVSITYKGQTFQMTEGDKVRAQDEFGEVEFFLLSSFFSQPSAIILSEGLPFYVTLMAYRVM